MNLVHYSSVNWIFS